jgi:transcriptional regulator with XRE-family HTH domain
MVLSNLAAGVDGIAQRLSGMSSSSPMPGQPTLGDTLKQARMAAGLSLREVERQIEVGSGHLSQIETGTIARPDMALLWMLAETYGIDFDRLATLAGYGGGGEKVSARQRQRMTVAMRAMRELSPAEQAEVLRFMAELKARRDD